MFEFIELKPCAHCGGTPIYQSWETERRDAGYIVCTICDASVYGAEAWNRRASGWRKLDQDAKEFAEVIVGHYDADNDEWRDICRAQWASEYGEWYCCDTRMQLIYKPTHYQTLTTPTQPEK